MGLSGIVAAAAAVIGMAISGLAAFYRSKAKSAEKELGREQRRSKTATHQLEQEREVNASVAAANKSTEETRHEAESRPDDQRPRGDFRR